MGKLIYGGEALSVEMDDLLLAHLQAVVSAKLRRSENFMLSWSVPREMGSGRHSLWIDPGVPLRFRFEHAARLQLDSDVMRQMIASASSNFGLDLTSLMIESGSGRVEPAAHFSDAPKRVRSTG